MERMSNAINAGVEELKEHLKINLEEIGYLETRLDRAKKDNEKLEKENKYLKEENKKLKEYNWELIENHKKDIAILCEENEKLREELSAYDREYFDEDKKAKNIYKSQKENILMWKI